jgi:acetylornithine/N-succinyldiaminopimelate aminotransferase
MSGVALPVMPDIGVASTPPSIGVGAPSAILGTYARAPITLVGGDSAELIANDGRRYLDFTSGIAVNALGYGDPGLQAVMRDAAEGLIHVSNLFRTEPAEGLAQWLVAHSFADKVFFCNSGAEANEGAFKFARRWARGVGGAEKHEIVALRGSFHGRLFASLAATDRPKYRAPFRPLAGGITIAERDIGQLAEMLMAETTAALVVEPVQGEGGVRVFDPGFLRELRSLTAERQIALVLDEVQCGLGRTGWLFAYERAGIEPDLLALAKPIAGGLPMGAVLLAGHIASAIEPGDHGTTFGGGPFVSTIAQYVVERIADPSLLQSVREHGEWLGRQLNRLAAESPHVRGVRGVGLIWGIDIAMRAGPVIDAAREHGLLLLSAGDHTLRLLPPLTITRSELERGIDTLSSVLA